MNEEMKDCHVPPLKNRRLWIIEFDIRMGGKGCAVVQANNPHECQDILRAEGVFNGTPSAYLINKIEEIVLPFTNSALVAEQIINYE